MKSAERNVADWQTVSGWGNMVAISSASDSAALRNRWMDSYWKFYLTKHRRQDLLERTEHFDPAQVKALPPGSLVLANVGNVTTDSLVAAGELKQVRVIPEVHGQEFFAILRR